VPGATVDGMDESRAVLERLERIEALDRLGVDSRELVAELRALLVDAEAWSRREGGEAGASAVEDLRRALERDMIGE
jgi:predicted Ser/Thr protein kinase